MASNLIAIASNLIAMASNLIAMASNIIAMASNLIAMASNLIGAALHDPMSEHLEVLHDPNAWRSLSARPGGVHSERRAQALCRAHPHDRGFGRCGDYSDAVVGAREVVMFG